jgi:hypothetical protein
MLDVSLLVRRDKNGLKATVGATGVIFYEAGFVKIELSSGLALIRFCEKNPPILGVLELFSWILSASLSCLTAIF